MGRTSKEVVLHDDDLRAVAAFAVRCAWGALVVFEHEHPDDPRPREAIGAGSDFADGGARNRLLRDRAWAALRAAREARTPAAAEAARAAMAAAGAAYVHPRADADQVKHILGAGAHRAPEAAR